MKKIVAAIFLTLVTSIVWAAKPVVPQKKVSKCGSADVLASLADTIRAANNLPPNLNYDFNDIKTLISATASSPDSFFLRCETNVTVVDPNKKIKDTLRLIYDLRDNGNGGYNVSFEPKR